MANHSVSPPEPPHDDPLDSSEEQLSRPKSRDRPVRSKRPTTSPFFSAPASTSPKKRSPRKTTVNKVTQGQDEEATLQPKKIRPTRGTVSCLPIPPLSAAQFGLIQEELAHIPFHLLMGVTFLVRTTGKAAIPIIRDFTARFPSPQSMADADPEEIISMIRHLGLSAVRCRNLQKYARTWLEQPPTKDFRYGVKNYPNSGDGARVHCGEKFGPEERADYDNEDANLHGLGSAWEIGHIAEGPYAIDSWRIFCRDKLLGRADDWLGQGREPEFQPEWMRVLPKDKELRAYLRWLWCREGWEWDPETGARSVLRDELREALNASRVGYDDQGRMVILEDRPSHQYESGVGVTGEARKATLEIASDCVSYAPETRIEEALEKDERRDNVDQEQEP